MKTHTKQHTIYGLIFGLFLIPTLALSPLAFAAPLGEIVNDDSSETPIDTDVTQSDAVAIAERVLRSLKSIGTPRLLTEEDGQVMWVIPYETNDGSQNEIVINTRTGAYRLVQDSDTVDDTDIANTAATNTETDLNETNRLGTTTVIVQTPINTASVTASTTLSLENQIIQLLQQIISLLRTQLAR